MKKLFDRIGKIGVIVFLIDLILIGITIITKKEYPAIINKIIITTFAISLIIVLLYYSFKAILGYIKAYRAKDKDIFKNIIFLSILFIGGNAILSIVFKKRIGIEKIIGQIILLFFLIGTGYHNELK